MPAKQKTLPEILAELRTWPMGHPFQSIADEVEAAVGRMRREYERLHECFWNIDSIQSIVRQMLDERDDLRDKNPQASEVAAHFAQLLTKAATPSPGNAAAMREALEKIADMKFHLGDFAEPVYGDSSAIYENAKWDGKKFLGREIPAWWGAGWRESLSRAIDTARAALAAPARNCDRPECKTFPDAIRFGHFECGHREWWVATMTSADWHDFADWLLAPAEGKEADHA